MIKKIGKLILFGFFVWLIPFTISILFFNKNGELLIDVFLFKSIMIVIGTFTGACILVWYFKKVKINFLKTSIVVGLVWFLISIVLDLIVLLPMSGMSVGSYFSEIGIRYLSLPILAITVGYLLEKNK
ncbi:MAG: hypothetical protein CO137_01690 [Candidatus Magasanikbacteria bacterium CG_4_9_14_3_um_filter_32_9]|uniref:Uncharacterized protein n=1 Tax=Candidatus Magasanikbacteria bacterium CG_4_9_14_3_um_filter_32_9 TaxID=1974644 RepID=A0A2M7Z729_9BACT|nr:MAG: hypothetical protein CO137_01690 [Candidatus Magasanikbacteria bacterium CG_4_9_14_3_um_filter_32_9]